MSKNAALAELVAIVQEEIQDYGHGDSRDHAHRASRNWNWIWHNGIRYEFDPDEVYLAWWKSRRV